MMSRERVFSETDLVTLVVRFRDQINLMECETAYEVKPCSFTSLNLQYAEESTVDADTKTGGSCPLRTHTTISFYSMLAWNLTAASFNFCSVHRSYEAGSMRQRTVAMYVEIGCFLSCLSGWILICSTLATEYWTFSAVGSVVLTTGNYYSNLWMDCVSDTTGVSDCKYYPSMMDLPGEESLLKLRRCVIIWRRKKRRKAHRS